MQEINKKTRKDLFMIDPRAIRVEKNFNSRINFDLDNLVESIRENGVLNAITVIKETNKEGNETYRLVDGERRYRAVMRLIEEGTEIARIPAIFIPKMSDADLLVQQIVRNDGKTFNEYEYGIACQKFLNYGWTKAEIARKLGKDSGMITYYLQHLSRDSRVQELIKTGRMSGSEVRRVYREHKDDEEGAVSEILKGKKTADEKGKKNITLSDLDVKGRTLSGKNSKIILAGLELLFEYYSKYSHTADGRTIDIDLDILDVKKALRDGKTIDEIFSEAKEKALDIYKEAL